MFPRLFVCLVLLTLSLAGCKDREIAAYRAPKDPAVTLPASHPTDTNNLPKDSTAPGAMPANPADMASTAVPTGSDNLTWTAPANWTAKPASAMRKGSFAVKGDGGEADLSITAFPGDTGGLLANLNRWRGQIALPPLEAAQLDSSVQHVEAGALHFEVVDFSGQTKGAPTRILGAVLAREGETWFFKLMGPDALVAKEKPAFLEFLRSVKEAGK